MSRPDNPVPIVAARSSSDAWLALSDELLWSINHALNNRLAALVSLARVLEANGPGGDPLLTMLVQEVERLNHTLALLRLVPRDVGEEPEPVLLADLVPQVIALHRLKADRYEIHFHADGADALLPVLIGRSTLVRALLLFLDQAGRAAEAGRQKILPVRCHGDEEEVAVVAELSAAPSAAGEADVQVDHASAVAAIEGLLLGSGGRLVRHTAPADAGGAATLQLRLPTLPATRRQQKADGTE